MDLDQTQTPSTTANDQSFGPALIGSSSLDSPSINQYNISYDEKQTRQLKRESTQTLNNQGTSSNDNASSESEMDSERGEHQQKRAQDQGISGETEGVAFGDDRPMEISELSPAVSVDVSGAAGDNPTYQHGFNGIDDFGSRNGPTISEAAEYADDLARELINDTDRLTNEEHSKLDVLASSAAEEAVETAISAIMTIKQEVMEECVEKGKDNVKHSEEVETRAGLRNEEQIVKDNSVQLEDKRQTEEQQQEKRSSFVVGQAALFFDQDSLDTQQQDLIDNTAGDTNSGDSYVKLESTLDYAQTSEIRRGQEKTNDTIEVVATATAADILKEASALVYTPAAPVTEVQEQTPEVLEGKIESREVDKSDVDPEVEKEVPKYHTVEAKMEFTKNYSDDLLMSSASEHKQQQDQPGDGHDLADFELPQFSGSSGSSGSEQAPVRNQASMVENVATSSSPSTSTDLTAIKNILISSYSKFSHVFHWKKPIESGIFLAIGLTLIAALTFFSIISVVAYSALGIILASGLIRIYKASMKALSKSTETPMDHIWNRALNLNVKMSPETLHKLVDSSHGNLNSSLTYFKQVLLVEDKLATCKFAFFLYILTYIGAWFNGLTLITITYLSLFSVPVFYEKNQTKIDGHLNLITGQISSTLSLVTNKVSALVFGSQSASSSSKKQN